MKDFAPCVLIRKREGYSWYRTIRRHLLGPFLGPLWKSRQGLLRQADLPGRDYSAIHPAFARRVGIDLDHTGGATRPVLRPAAVSFMGTAPDHRNECPGRVYPSPPRRFLPNGNPGSHRRRPSPRVLLRPPGRTGHTPRRRGEDGSATLPGGNPPRRGSVEQRPRQAGRRCGIAAPGPPG